MSEARIDALLSLAIGFTEADFADLAVAAADQAGMSAKDQVTLRAMLAPKCTQCASAIDDYGASPKDEQVAPSAGLCEDCHTTEVRVAKRTERQRIEGGRGDYMRDQQKDAP